MSSRRSSMQTFAVVGIAKVHVLSAAIFTLLFADAIREWVIAIAPDAGLHRALVATAGLVIAGVVMACTSQLTPEDEAVRAERGDDTRRLTSAQGR